MSVTALFILLFNVQEQFVGRSDQDMEQHLHPLMRLWHGTKQSTETTLRLPKCFALLFNFSVFLICFIDPG